MFPINVSLCAHLGKHCFQKQNLLPMKRKMLPNKFKNIFVAEIMFPSLPTCFQMFPARETLFSRLGTFKQRLKTVVQT